LLQPGERVIAVNGEDPGPRGSQGVTTRHPLPRPGGQRAIGVVPIAHGPPGDILEGRSSNVRILFGKLEGQIIRVGPLDCVRRGWRGGVVTRWMNSTSRYARYAGRSCGPGCHSRSGRAIHPPRPGCGAPGHCRFFVIWVANGIPGIHQREKDGRQPCVKRVGK
jgi:hypothetical protein